MSQKEKIKLEVLVRHWFITRVLSSGIEINGSVHREIVQVRKELHSYEKKFDINCIRDELSNIEEGIL